jgi:hypothetical protein
VSKSRFPFKTFYLPFLSASRNHYNDYFCEMSLHPQLWTIHLSDPQLWTIHLSDPQLWTIHLSDPQLWTIHLSGPQLWTIHLWQWVPTPNHFHILTSFIHLAPQCSETRWDWSRNRTAQHWEQQAASSSSNNNNMHSLIKPNHCKVVHGFGFDTADVPVLQ